MRTAPWISLWIALGLVVTGCDVRERLGDRAAGANDLVIKGQVALKQATETARSDVEARAVQEAAATIAAARIDGGGEYDPSLDPQQIDQMELEDRYAARRLGDGWAVYDTATGRVVRDGLEETSIGARGRAEAMNRAASRPRQ